MDERKLLRMAQDGDKEAFQQLILAYYPYVSKFLLKLSGSEQDAQDLTQETFLKLIRSIRQYEPSGQAAFATYLMTIAKHCYLDFLRRNRHIAIDFDALELPSGEFFEGEIERREDAAALCRAIETLPPEQALAVRLRHFERQSLEEIAAQMGVESKTAKSRIHLGVVKLRKTLGGTKNGAE